MCARARRCTTGQPFGRADQRLEVRVAARPLELLAQHRQPEPALGGVPRRCMSPLGSSLAKSSRPAAGTRSPVTANRSSAAAAPTLRRGPRLVHRRAAGVLGDRPPRGRAERRRRRCPGGRRGRDVLPSGHAARNQHVVDAHDPPGADRGRHALAGRFILAPSGVTSVGPAPGSAVCPRRDRGRRRPVPPPRSPVPRPAWRVPR